MKKMVMWFLWCLLIVSVALLMLVLFMPLVIRIDTFAERYSLRWGPAAATLALTPEDVVYRINAPFFHREGSLLQVPDQQRTKKHVAPPDTGTRQPAQRRPYMRRLLQRLLASFRVERFQWYLDTGDPLWNAWLFPVFHMWRMRGADVRISFTGAHGLRLDLRNNAFRLLWAALRSFRSTPNNTRP